MLHKLCLCAHKLCVSNINIVYVIFVQAAFHTWGNHRLLLPMVVSLSNKKGKVRCKMYCRTFHLNKKPVSCKTHTLITENFLANMKYNPSCVK